MTPLPTNHAIQDKTRDADPVDKEAVFALTDAAGMKRGDVECTIKNESGWNPRITHLDGDGTVDEGLWQINSSHHLPESITLDPMKSTEYAVSLWKERGWSPWNAYRQFCI